MSGRRTARATRRAPERLRTEIAVVGSGPGGATTAAALAEAGRDVLLIEEGPQLPLDSCAPFSRAEMIQKYRRRGVTVALGRPNVVYVEGRCVGGGSEINSALYRRTPPEILEQWQREFRVEALGAEDMRPHFEACEEELGVTLLRGPAPSASLRLREGAERLGWKSVETPRCFRYEPAAGDVAPRGRRQSMTRTLLPRALANGCRLQADTRVRALRRRGSGWTLEAEANPASDAPGGLRVDSDSVFVCGGAIQTPALLRRSGIRGRVGAKLKLQSMIKVVARFEGDVNEAGMGVPPEQVQGESPRFGFGCSVSTPAQIALAMSDHGHRARRVIRDWRRAAVFYAVLRSGTGSVRPVPFSQEPLVRYRFDRGDLLELSDALRDLCRLLLAAGAVELYPSVRNLAPIARDSDLERIPRPLPARDVRLTTVHLSSSCLMGEDRARCAADSFGRVHGVEGLHVADASLLCGAPGANPQATIMALARRNAFRFLGRL